MVAFNDSYRIIDVIPVTGADALDGLTLTTDAVIDNEDGTVTLTMDVAHTFLAGSVVYIEGTDEYDGLHEILSVPETDEIRFKAKYVAETPAGSETVKIVLKSKRDFKFLGFRLNIAVAPGQADVMTITLDSGKGATYDTVIYSNDLTAVTELEYINPNVDLPFDKGDILRVAWPNVANRTFGMEFFISPLN
jgi:hypothetical protein